MKEKNLLKSYVGRKYLVFCREYNVPNLFRNLQKRSLTCRKRDTVNTLPTMDRGQAFPITAWQLSPRSIHYSPPRNHHQYSVFIKQRKQTVILWCMLMSGILYQALFFTVYLYPFIFHIECYFLLFVCLLVHQKARKKMQNR